MDLTTYQQPEQPTQQLSVAPEPQYETCDECGTPVDRDQRYCVVCGARRKHVYDPAARFLAGATSRNRRGTGATRPSSPAASRPRRFQSVGTALAIAIIPVAIGLGVVLGKSGGGNDQQLLDAIRSQKPPVVNVGGGGIGAVASTDTGSNASSKGKDKGKGKPGTGSSGPKKVLAKTSNGTFTSLTSTKPPSQAQLNQNEQIVKQVQNTINQHYVDSQKNLPNSIAVP